MTDETKLCKHHGVLPLDKFTKAGKCKQCRKIIMKNNYEKNKEKILAKNTEYRKKDPKKSAAMKYESWKKHKHKYLERQRISDRAYRQRNHESLRIRDNAKKRKYTNTLHDVYIRQKLVSGTPLSATMIPKSLVEFKRAQILLKRAIQKKKDEEKLHILLGKING